MIIFKNRLSTNTITCKISNKDFYNHKQINIWTFKITYYKYHTLR